MPNLLAQFDFSKIDWAELIFPALIVFSTAGGALVKFFKKDKDEPLDAEIEDMPARPPTQQQPPIARPPQPARRLTTHPQTPAPTARQPVPSRIPAHRQPASPMPQPQHDPHRTARTPATPTPAAPRKPVRQAQREIARALHERAQATMEDSQLALKQSVAEAIEIPPAAGSDKLKLDPVSLRQAIILSEILAPPVALRDPSQGVGNI